MAPSNTNQGAGAPRASRPLRSIRTVAAASSIGTGLEFYDFFLYGTTAALVFGEVFFPNYSSTAGTLASFATFAVGFLARPLGAILFGHLGDRVGRKPILLVTLSVTGAATFLVGLLPGYARIGIWAPVLLVVLRLLQGIGLGGEAGGGQLIIAEHAPPERRGFYAAWASASQPISSALATGMVLLFSSVLDHDQFVSWGWRVPFLLSVIVVVVGLVIRLRVTEPAVFAAVKQRKQRQALPVIELLRGSSGRLVLAAGMWFGATVGFYFNNVFSLSYATKHAGVGGKTMLVLLVIASLLSFGFPLAAGALSDRYGRRPVVLGSAVFSAVVAIPYLAMFNTGSPVLILLALCLLNAGVFAMSGVQPALFAEMFDVRVRYSGMSLAFTIGNVIGGGLAPLVASAIADRAGTAWVTVYVVASLLVSVAFAYWSKEAAGTDLAAGGPATTQDDGAEGLPVAQAEAGAAPEAG
jgi:MHS family shikimate/dehydroshikimate transporter-like MFS transporter